MRFQRRAGLSPDGVLGPRTRKAFGRYGRRDRSGGETWRSAAAVGRRGAQFALAWHGFPSAVFDGVLGAHTDTALRKFQHWAGLDPDGTAGPSRYRDLRRPVPRSPIKLLVPVAGVRRPVWPAGRSLPCGHRHPGLEKDAVTAAAAGRVVFAAVGEGFGKLVVLEHRNGVRTRYAHLSRITVRVGQYVNARATVGLVGATGEATGPHLHFKVLVRGANVDPLSAF